MNYIRFCKDTTEKQQFEDGKSESLHTQLYTRQVSHFLYDMPVITIIIKLCCAHTSCDLQVVALITGGES